MRRLVPSLVVSLLIMIGCSDDGAPDLKGENILIISSGLSVYSGDNDTLAMIHVLPDRSHDSNAAVPLDISRSELPVEVAQEYHWITVNRTDLEELVDDLCELDLFSLKQIASDSSLKYDYPTRISANIENWNWQVGPVSLGDVVSPVPVAPPPDDVADLLWSGHELICTFLDRAEILDTLRESDPLFERMMNMKVDLLRKGFRCRCLTGGHSE